VLVEDRAGCLTVSHSVKKRFRVHCATSVEDRIWHRPMAFSSVKACVLDREERYRAEAWMKQIVERAARWATGKPISITCGTPVRPPWTVGLQGVGQRDHGRPRVTPDALPSGEYYSGARARTANSTSRVPLCYNAFRSAYARWTEVGWGSLRPLPSRVSVE
jgi:hypothetical protein